MGIFDDVVVNAKTAASAVGKKAEQIVDLSKLKYAAAGLNNEISKKKEALGAFVYESSKEGKLDHEILQDKIKELSELEENYLATKEMIVAAKNKKSCKACGSENEKEASFCSRCGERLDDKDNNEAESDEKDEESASSVTDAVENVSEKAEKTVENVCETVKDKVEEAVEKTEELVDEAKEKFTD